MNRLDLILRVRSYTRDFSNATFRESDIISYINEGIQRMRQLVPELSGMTSLRKSEDNVQFLPSAHHHLLALYSAARCFEQDERHYQAGNLMNEFETKMRELIDSIMAGTIIIVDPVTGEPIVRPHVEDYVTDVYFAKRRGY